MQERDRAISAIAYLVCQIREESGARGWNQVAVVRALNQGKCVGATITELTRAAVTFAQRRTDQETPFMLAQDGRHWDMGEDGPSRQMPKPPCLTEPLPQPLDREVIDGFMTSFRDRVRKAREEASQ